MYKSDRQKHNTELEIHLKYNTENGETKLHNTPRQEDTKQKV